MIGHHIQKEIINQLMFNKCLRFSALKPDGMESNIFMYHLKQLMKDGYVDKCDAGYTLGHAGLQYVDGLSSKSMKPRKQPKLITILALQGPDDKWLLAERRTQPYIGQRMFISGKQHFGETISQHAAREMIDTLGVTSPLRYRGLAEIAITDGDELLTQVVAHVHYGRLPSGDIPEPTAKFNFVWHDFAASEQPLMAGTKEIYSALQDHDDSRFLLEITAPTTL